MGRKNGSLSVAMETLLFETAKMIIRMYPIDGLRSKTRTG